jgi:hypothetical protein
MSDSSEDIDRTGRRDAIISCGPSAVAVPSGEEREEGRDNLTRDLFHQVARADDDGAGHGGRDDPGLLNEKRAGSPFARQGQDGHA